VPTPFEHLEDYKGASLALSFVIEGFATTFSTASTADMVGVYTGDSSPYSQFSDPIGGMFARGELTESIKLYTPDIDPSSIEVSIVDNTGALASLFRENYSSGHRTYLTANLLAGNDHTEGDAAGVISVQSTTVTPGAGFGASGTIYIGGEAITYTGTTATTFTGCTRGVYAVNQTSSATAFSPSHLIGNNITASATTAPSVTDYPRTWYGRQCHVFLHIKDQVTGVYTKPSASTKIFTGRIEMYGDDGQGNINIQLKSATDVLMRPLGPDQWRAKIATGLIFASPRLGVRRADTGATYYVYTAMTGLSATEATSHDELAAEINAEFRGNTWDSGGTTTAGDQWSLELEEDADGKFRYRMLLDPGTTAAPASSQILFQLHPSAMRLLGFKPDGGTGLDESGVPMAVRWMHRESTGKYSTRAEDPPIVYKYTRLETNISISVSDEVGTLVEQTGGVDFASSWGGNAVIQIKGGRYDGVYICEYTSGTPSKIKVHAVLDRATGVFSPYANPEDPEGDGAVRLGDPGDETPEVKQVLLYRGSAGTLLLRCLLSTGGASGYNHTEYDTLTTAGFGLGIPSSLIDVPSWEALNDATIEMFVGEPKPFYEMLEPILQMTGSYVVWKAADELSNPKISVVQPSLDTAYLATWQLSEANKTRPDERTRVTRALDGIVSRVVVKSGHGLGAVTEASKTYTLDNIASQTDYGKRRTMTINAGPVVNYESLMATTLAPALAYFSRPLAVAERSYNASCVRMAPGDSVTLTDNYVIDPATGARGSVIYAWVLDTSFDLATMQGRARCIFLPEKSPNFTAPWAPSARVDETVTGGGFTAGYSAGAKRLALRANEYSPSGAARDYTRFAVGDKVRVVQIDAAAPLEWFDTIAVIPAVDQLQLSVGLAGYVTTNRYVVEFDDVNTVVSTQRDVAYLADAATLSTGYAAGPLPLEWGSGPIAVSGATVDHSVGMFRPETRYDDQGEPCSIHKQTHLVYGANSMLAYRTRNVHLCEYLGNRTQTGTTPRLVFMAWVPIYGHSGNDGTRSLVVKVRGFQTGGGTATFVVASSQIHPAGTSYTSFTFPGGFNTVTATTTSATNVWSAEMTLRPAVVEAGDGNKYTWVSLYISGSGGGITATVNQISVAEAAL
jgi:hypothetical protein